MSSSLCQKISKPRQAVLGSLQQAVLGLNVQDGIFDSELISPLESSLFLLCV